ncbi:MAG: polyhydroxyalkanoate synthesis repressor PhaR [Alphaproteobacteria bacterium]|nr:polyhydroxyalkanoate synthesis repressor PhaR [Alphaproteobacteria bacterium]
MATQNEGPVTIKKYANRRLYNTATSSYVTLEHLAEMVKRGQEFNVYDAKSGEDITRSVLAQIIFEEEGKSGQQSMLPIQFLRQLIRFYGDSMQALVPGYLEISMESFARNQERMREQFATAFGGKNMMKEIEQITRQNMAMFERAVRMFTPFGALMGGRGGPGVPGATPAENGAAMPQDEAAAGEASGHNLAAEEEIAELKGQIEAMKRQLNDIASRKT